MAKQEPRPTVTKRERELIEYRFALRKTREVLEAIGPNLVPDYDEFDEIEAFMSAIRWHKHTRGERLSALVLEIAKGYMESNGNAAFKPSYLLELLKVIEERVPKDLVFTK